MTYRTLLVPIDQTPGCEHRIRFAADLARACGGALVGVGSQPLEVRLGMGYGYVDGELIQAVREQIAVDLTAWKEKFHAAAGTVDSGLHWIGDLAYPAVSVAARAVEADLVVTTRAASGRDFYASPSDLVMECGAPVLLAPEHPLPLSARRVVIGWKDTRETRRAVMDALPFLRGADQVLLLEVRESHDIAPPSSDAHAIQRRLERHGVQATVKTEARKGPAAEAILATALGIEAGLIVAGAYGHSRLREWTFGGVTQALLHDAGIPVLFSR